LDFLVQRPSYSQMHATGLHEINPTNPTTKQI
jgi:hypothetical protein